MFPRRPPVNAYKLNVIFMDGHSERMGDLEAAKPHMWLPAGSHLDASAMYPDARAKYGGPGMINIGS